MERSARTFITGFAAGQYRTAGILGRLKAAPTCLKETPARVLLDAPEPDDDFSRKAFASADEDRAGQPLQVWCGGLEGGYGAEVDKLRIDDFAFEKLLHHRRRGVTNAGVLDVDDLTLIGLEHVARVE